MDTRIGVIGVGTIGYHHARIYAELPGVELTAVCDTDDQRARRVAAAFGCRSYRDHEALVRAADVDAVSVAVPTLQHETVGTAALSAGLHALVEKPLATSVPGAQRLTRIAQSRGVVLAVGHVERFNPAVIQLKHLIETGALGAITSIQAKRVGLLPTRAPDTDVILDLAIHDIDVVTFLLGREPTEVVATAGSAVLNHTYDHAEVFLKYDGLGCFIQANWITPVKIRTLTVTGSKAYTELNYITQELKFFEATVATSHQDFPDFLAKFGEPRTGTVDLPREEPLRRELAGFVAAVSHGDGAALVTPEESIAALRVVERAQRSLQEATSAAPRGRS